MATWEDTNHDNGTDTHPGNHTDTTVLASGFMETPTVMPSKVADGFTYIERHNPIVGTILLHPSLVHRFVMSFHDSMDADIAYPTVGTLWGATITLDPDAPRNGFILKSGDYCVRFLGPELPSSDSAGVPTVLCKHPVRAWAIAELLDLGRPWGTPVENLRLESTAATYSGFRKFGRGILDIETRAHMLKTGFMGTMYGVKVMVARDAHPTQIVLRDQSRILAILETGMAANASAKERTDKILEGAPQDEYVDRLMEGLWEGVNAKWAEIAYDLDNDRLDLAKDALLRAVTARLMARYGTHPA